MNFLSKEKLKINPNQRYQRNTDWDLQQILFVLDSTIYRWKAIISIDGGKQVRGQDYWETYARTTSWRMTGRIIRMGSKII
jgi:hypothetical protein